MMKNFIFAVIVSLLLLSPVTQAAAQANLDSSGTFDTSSFPQWARDLRRWEIIAFGAFPFSMFTVTFFSDLYRWNEANGMDFNDRRYAPWPLKSAGAIEMTKEEYERTILLAIGLSAAIAFTDLVIVKVKQHNQRRQLERMPSGTVIIERTPPQTAEPEIEIEAKIETEIEAPLEDTNGGDPDTE